MSGDMYEAEIWTIARMEEGTVVALRPLDSGLLAPIFISESEARAILLGLNGVAVSRPRTHDVFLDLLRKVSLALLRVEVHDVRNNVFYARILLTGGDFSGEHPLVLDSRPSDALALAVRSGGPVFVSRTVMDKTGLPLDFFIEAAGGSGGISADSSKGAPEDAEPGLSGVSARRESLKRELDRAVATEEYERAAELRDVLELLDRKDGDGR